MVFYDKWNTSYPNELKAFIKSKEIIDSSPEIKQLGNILTRNSMTSDEAIMNIHEFIKNTINVGHVPLVLDIPVKKASEQLKSCIIDPEKKNLCHQKTILETALLRSQGIPTRVSVALCGVHDSRMQLSPMLRTINIIAPYLSSIPIFPHTYPEIYAYDKDGNGKWRRKDAWIPEFACKNFEGTCTKEEEKQWKKNKDVPDVQNFLNCKNIQASNDFPAWLEKIVNAGFDIRESTHVLDLVDPTK